MKLTPQTSVFLDIVRGISAQLVLVGHLLSFYNIYGYQENSGELIIQNFGVVVFFILSGFLISYSVNNKGANYNFKDYFIDRFSRIYIAFFPALFVIFILDKLAISLNDNYAYGSTVHTKHFFGNILMLQDFPLLKILSSYLNFKNLDITSLGSGRPLWTVAIEWWMYLFFGFLVYKKLNNRNLIFWILLLVVPIFNMASRGNGLSVVWFSGVLIFYLFKSGSYTTKHPWRLVLLLLLAASCRLIFNKFQVYDLAFSLPISFAFFFMVKEFQQSPLRYMFLLKLKGPAQKIANFSFSLYLLHYTIIVFIINLNLGINKWLELLASFIISNILSFAFAYVTEYRYHDFRKFIRRRFVFKPSTQLAKR